MSDYVNRLLANRTADPCRLLPQSEAAEKGLISSLLIAPKDVFGLCVEKGITNGHFFTPALRIMYRELYAAWDRNEDTDFITLTQTLRDKGLLDECGGASYVTDLFTLLPTAANAAYYVEILHEKFWLRRIIDVGTTYVGRGYEEQEEVEGLLDRMEEDVLAIRGKRPTSRQTMRDVVGQVLGDLDQMLANPGKLGGLPTGFHDFDRKIDGMKGQEMIVLAARPSVGKSAFGMQIVEHLAINLGIPCAVFSLEMSTKQLVQRMVLSRARVNPYRVREGQMIERDFPAIQAASYAVAAAPIFVQEESGQTIQEMRAVARRLKAEHKIGFAMIDYLQIARSSTKRAQDNRTQEVAEISAGVKAMAKELDIPVMVLAQIDRSVDKQNRRPKLSDLRESSAIEQDADKVVFLQRDEVQAETAEERYALKGKANAIVAKHRGGEIGDVPLRFLNEFVRFEDMTVHEPDCVLI